uniref:Uncharacterized protein n=1 Tax=Cannabis sativa TaxID=3483 RepID=A0A803P9W1_CANSA
MDPNQSTRPHGKLVEPGNDKTNPLAPLQPSQAAPIEPVLPPAPVPVVGNPGFVLPHQEFIFEHFVKLQPLTFLGGTNIIKAGYWMSTISRILDDMGVTKTERVNCVAFMFQEHASVWWDIVGQTKNAAKDAVMASNPSVGGSVSKGTDDSNPNHKQKFNNTAYPNDYYGPTGLEASQAQAFTFLVRDQCLGADVGSTKGPTSLGPENLQGERDLPFKTTEVDEELTLRLKAMRSVGGLSQDDLEVISKASPEVPPRPHGQETTKRPKSTGVHGSLGRPRDLCDLLTRRWLVESETSKRDPTRVTEAPIGIQSTVHGRASKTSPARAEEMAKTFGVQTTEKMKTTPKATLRCAQDEDDIDPYFGEINLGVGPTEELKEFPLNTANLTKVVKIGIKLTEVFSEMLMACLGRNQEIFSLLHEDMIGIDPQVICHALNIEKVNFRSVQQKCRLLDKERSKILNEEVERLREEQLH